MEVLNGSQELIGNISSSGKVFASLIAQAGPKGKDGTGLTILGAYATLEDLKISHPTGNVGDAYMIDTNLYVWNAICSDWMDVGNIQGPQGEQGVQGEKGDTGADGKAGTIAVGSVTTGEPGTSAIVTNSGTDNAAIFDFIIPQGVKGDTGEQGPQGEQGIQGEQGPQGEEGTDVIISSTEPTGGDRKKVWMQKGNLYNSSNNTVGYYLDDSGAETANSAWEISEYISITPGESYETSGVTVPGTAPYCAYYDSDKNFISSFKNSNTIITTPTNAYYVRFSLNSADITNFAFSPCFAIYIKNDNGEYDECMKKENTNSILEVTDSTYNIRLRVFKTGKTIFLDLYTINVATALSTGSKTILLVTLPEGSRPSVILRKMLSTAAGNKFVLTINPDGRILITHVYQAIGTGEQIVENTTFLAN